MTSDRNVAVFDAASDDAALDAAGDGASTETVSRIAGHIKWFDGTRGCGFLVPEDEDGDILVHFSVLRDHGRRTLPEGVRIECIFTRSGRGRQTTEILSIDLDGCEDYAENIQAATKVGLMKRCGLQQEISNRSPLNSSTA